MQWRENIEELYIKIKHSCRPITSDLAGTNLENDVTGSVIKTFPFNPLVSILYSYKPKISIFLYCHYYCYVPIYNKNTRV